VDQDHDLVERIFGIEITDHSNVQREMTQCRSGVCEAIRRWLQSNQITVGHPTLPLAMRIVAMVRIPLSGIG
jgi:hypothetical protein